ncbi:MutS-related protein [Clostridium cibarium]|uniref:DNA mismatch repair protein MutS n=1 Tax=Clostridium cibarium TaxID=2762247 RepID=A0ABR8PW21_9CLOT|nr:DNA mismatch repair protein MutS [Clostridium cibarium]MBD7912386.1 DNA mismatch repair protein MutS [Clostridium cibarium]
MNSVKRILSSDFTRPKEKRRNMNKIRKLFDLSKKNKYTIDETTWDDLLMDDIFTKLDRTCSTAGEAMLYHMLRNPLMDKNKLQDREKYIKLFRENTDLSAHLRYILFYMGFDSNNNLIEMIEGLLSVNKLKFLLYKFLGQVLPLLLSILAIIFKEPKFIFLIFILININIRIQEKEKDTVKATGIVYLGKLLLSSIKLSKVDNLNLSPLTKRINLLLNELKSINRSIKFINIITGLGGIMEFLSVPFLLEATTYYKISGRFIEKRDTILSLYSAVGEIDALISIASYIESNKDKCTTPLFIDKTTIKITEGIHPLLDNPVANSITIDHKGIVLTGTNMSGKSTFLRMITVNILLAQTFNFVLAKSYEACFFNIISSISPKDDINNNKSYYISEAESILRILKSLNDYIPVFCPIDEIFRGTNPIERIASSAEILNYINKKNAICIVATHDRELSNLLNGEYDFYFFSEDVNISTGLNFDYKLKEGISKTRNAIKLLDYAGFPKEITKGAYKRAKSLSTNFI